MIDKIEAEYGTHMPVLMKLFEITDGPIVEFGTGLFSTLYFHWACYLKKRKLVSFDNDKSYCDSLESFNNDYHQIIYAPDWDKIDVSGKWSIAFIDHAPNKRRSVDAGRMANSADYVVIHDSQARVDRHYRYSNIYHLFKYKKEFDFAHTHTTVLSNFNDLSNLTL